MAVFPYELLTRRLLPTDMHVEHLRAIKRRMKLPGIEVGIFPRDSILPVAPIDSCIFDNKLSYQEWGKVGQTNDDAADIRSAQDDFDALSMASVWGADAYRMIDDAIHEVSTIDLRPSQAPQPK